MPTLQGNAALHAAAVASYQSLAAGDAYPYSALKIVSPKGSAIPAGTPVIGFVPGLNLYTPGVTFNGDVATMTFSEDAAGTQAAGDVTMTLPASANGSVDYQSYPVQVTVDVHIPGGYLPGDGHIVITFTAKEGANTMVGSLSIKNATIDVDINLTLSDSLEVGGTVKIVESGATIHAGNIGGSLLGTLHCDISVDPYGWTGTGTLNLVTGAITLNLNTGNGTFSASIDASGNLSLTYPDGTSELVANPIQAPLVGAGQGDGGAAGSYVMTTQEFSQILQINNVGQMLGSTLLGSEFLSSPSASAQGASIPGGTANAMNNGGQIVGGSFDSPSLPALWVQPIGAPTKLSATGYPEGAAAVGITDPGQIIGLSNPAGSAQQVLFWANASAVPVALPWPMTAGNSTAIVAVSSDGRIVGSYYSGGYQLAYWQSPTSQPAALATPPGGAAVSSIHINSAGQIIASVDLGAGASSAYAWASPTAQPTLLAPLPTGAATQVQANGIDSAGLIVGSSGGPADGPHAVTWKNGQVSDLNALLPAGLSWHLAEALAVNDQGQVPCRPAGGQFMSNEFPVVIVTLK